MVLQLCGAADAREVPYRWLRPSKGRYGRHGPQPHGCASQPESTGRPARRAKPTGDVPFPEAALP